MATCAVLILASAPARSHAVLLETVPSDGAVLSEMPALLLLRFNEPVSVVTLGLIDGAGRNLLAGEPAQPPGAQVRIVAPAAATSGWFVLSYRVVSADGHPIAGAVTFAVGDGTARAPPVAGVGGDDAAWRLASAVARTLVYGSILLAAGSALFVVLVCPGLADDRRWRGAARGAALVAGLAVIGSIPIQGASLAGAPASALRDPALWSLGWSSLGVSTSLTLIGLAALLVGYRLPGPFRPVALGAGALLAIGGFGATGHAATADPRWLTAPAVIAHGIVAAFWIGSLPPLLRVLHTVPGHQVGRIIRRFSRQAVVAVILLLVAGTALAIVQVASVDALLTTTYGRLLLVKLIGVAGLLGLAAANKWRFTPALARGSAMAAKGLFWAIKAEIVVAALVIVATAGLGTTPPPRALAVQGGHDHHHDDDASAATATRYVVAAPMARYTAFVEVTPARPGTNQVRVRIQTNAPVAPFQPREVALELSNRAAGIEALSRPARPDADGSYLVDGPEMSLAGDWTIRVDALVSDFEQLTFEVEVPIR